MSNQLILIEDDDLLRESLTRLLNVRGFEVIEAEDATAGINLFRLHRPEIVITDLNLPGLNGLDVATTIREEDENCKIFVISGLPSSEVYFQVAEKIGAICCFQKPVDILALCETVEKHCGRDGAEATA